MPAIHETAYPRLKSDYSEEELSHYYTPIPAEIAFVRQQTTDPDRQIILLIWLKVFQRLGYFPPWKQIPPPIGEHISRVMGGLFVPPVPTGYDTSGTRFRHTKLIRQFLGIHPLGQATQLFIKQAAGRAAQTKNHLADIINAVLEELVRDRRELPAFSTLVRFARSARGQFTQQCFHVVDRQLTRQQADILDAILFADQTPSLWDKLKQEPAKPTPAHIRQYLSYVDWLRGVSEPLPHPLVILPAKQDQFYEEALAANKTDMRRFPLAKRRTLALVLLSRKRAGSLDDVVQILIKLVQGLHARAKQLLETYHATQRETLEELILQLAQITIAYQTEGDVHQRWAAVVAAMPDDPQTVLDRCHQHLAYAQNNHLLCLLPLYRAKRSLLFDCLACLSLQSSSNDHSLMDALTFMLTHRSGRKEWIDLPLFDATQSRPLDLDWLPDKWRRLVTGKTTRDIPVRLHRKYFELCVFTELMRQLKSGDVYAVGSREFDDYREHLLDWKQVNERLSGYETLTGIPTQSEPFGEHLKRWLLETAHQVDKAFPKNTSVRLEDGQILLSKSVGIGPPPQAYEQLDGWLKERMQPVNVLSVILKTEAWLNLSGNFYPLSGYESRLEAYPQRLAGTLFCYGCHLGPAQTARSVPGVNRKQLAWINQHHVTEERLNAAIVEVINSYNRFSLPRYWGSGKRASADGTKWNLYEQNLLSEYHIRYGGYGGIGYYHVSDTYIALFSHFIPCGVYEAIYILDGLLKNTSSIQPDTLHGDTQAQSVAVFGLAYLLGIQLMPRIRNLKELSLFRPDKDTAFTYIDPLFGDSIHWDLIKTHLPDMLRVVLSIQAGQITPSTILRRLGTFSRKNKLYFAFRELGRVVRTQFLLDYIHDEALRGTIQAATAKSEEFNEFTKWLSFGNPGLIAANSRIEQQKIVKYNHLVANLLILYNVNEMTRVLAELLAEGYPVEEAALPYLSPYRRDHVNRFGSYSLELEGELTALQADIRLFDRS